MDEANLKPFVSHRVGEIQEFSDAEDWRWLPTHLNVADEATSLISEVDFSSHSRWRNGPEFLKETEDQWPRFPCPTVVSEVLEVKKPLIANFTVWTSLIEIRRFSNWIKLIRVTAYVLRCLSLRRKFPISHFLEPDELDRAEVMWWKWRQRNSFQKEINLIKLKKSIPKKSKLFKLSPFLDEYKVLRMKSRVQQDLGSCQKNPIILDAKDFYVGLIIRFHHEKAGHHGMDQVCNNLKQKFCIPGFQTAVRKTWANCQHCKTEPAKPKVPEMASLSYFRLQTFQRPFAYTGLDYFGPFEVSIGRRREKKYGALFTCLVTRAVHVEMVGSLNSDALIMALRRFIGRRGNPKEIHSDNGTKFVGGSRELKDALEDLNKEQITGEMRALIKGWVGNWLVTLAKR